MGERHDGSGITPFINFLFKWTLKVPIWADSSLNIWLLWHHENVEPFQKKLQKIYTYVGMTICNIFCWKYLCIIYIYFVITNTNFKDDSLKESPYKNRNNDKRMK